MMIWKGAMAMLFVYHSITSTILYYIGTHSTVYVCHGSIVVNIKVPTLLIIHNLEVERGKVDQSQSGN
jgi:hypothetical protein